MATPTFRRRGPVGRSIGAVALEWNGDRLKERAITAAKEAIQETMEAAAKHAQKNHLGWNNRTGKLEGSLGVRRKPKESGRHGVAGNWGSNVRYSFYIEKRFGFLQAAADKVYPELAERIAQKMKPDLDA